MKCNELIEPQDPRELRDPRGGNRDESSRGTQAEGRKCRWVSFANKGREERGTSREEGGERSEDTGGRKGRMRKDSGRGGWREDERRKGKEAGGSHSVHQLAHFGTLFTRIVSPRVRHLRPQRNAGFT